MRQPIIKAANQRKQHAAHQHVVHMCDDKMGVVHLPVEGNQGQHHPSQPTANKNHQKAEHPQHGQFKPDFAAPQCRQPREYLDARGHRHQHARHGKKGLGQMRNADREHVMHPQAKADKAHGDNGEHNPTVTHQRTLGEDRNQGGNNPRRRQKNDVHLRVAEQPEQMLPQQRIAAAQAVKKDKPGGAFQLQHDAGENQRRKAEQNHQRHGQYVPAENRHFLQAHARRAHAQNRHHQFHPGGHRRDLHKGDAQQPKIRPAPRAEGGVAQRRIHKPAGTGGDAPQQAGAQNDAAEQIAEITQRPYARIGQIAGADHFGNQVHGQPFEHRDGEQKHHHRAVHGEQLVVHIRAEQFLLRQRQLRAHQHCEYAADQKEHDPGNHKADAHGGVIHG